MTERASAEPPFWAWVARRVLAARGLPAVFAVLTLVSLALLPRLTFDFSPQTLFDATSERARVYAEYRAQYGADDHVLLVLVEADLATAAGWRLLAELEGRIAAEVPAVERMTSLVSQEVPRWTEEGIAVRPLPGADGALPPDDATAAALLAEARAHPLLRRTLVAESGRVASLVLKVADDVDRIVEVRPVIDALQAILDEAVATHPGARLHLLGPHAYRTTVVGVMVREELRFAPLTAAVLALVLLAMFRSLPGVVIPLLSVGLGALLTLALMAGTGEPINIINTITATLILVIGIADAIHVVERYAQERGAGVGRDEAVRRAMVWVGGACLLTSVTTAVGFATLGTAHLSILRRFGAYSAAGVMITYLVTLVFVPAALRRFGLSRDDREGRPGPATPSWWDRGLDRALRRVADLAVRRPAAILAAALLATGGAAAGIPRLTVDNFIMEYVPKGEPILSAHHLLERELAGVVYFDVVLDVVGEAPPEPFHEPDLLARAARAEAAILAHPRVHSSESPLGLLRELRYVQRGAEPEVDRLALPATRREVASLLLLGEMGGHESIARTHLSADGRRLRLTFRAGDLGARGYLALEEAAYRDVHAAFAGSAVEVRPLVTGTSQVGYSGIDSLVRDLLGSLGWAFVLIAATLALLFRSVRIAVLAMIPNAVPLLLVLGAMGWAGRHLETLSAMVFSIGLGIAVDDTIHFVARYTQEVRSGLGPEAAVRRTMEATGRAIVTTSLVLLAGFAVLATSAFPPNQSFALLASAVIATALLADLFLLPALLLLWQPRVPGAEGAR